MDGVNHPQKNSPMKYIASMPATTWLRTYSKPQFIADLTAAIIVTILLIPQSLAYAMLAQVPPEVGLYSSILPLVLYALLGSSRTLSVGPVAVVSLMTATSLGGIVQSGTADYLTAAITLALLSGVILLLMGYFKLGTITNFLSHSVISGFITASGIIIAVSQIKHIFGIDAHGDTLVELLPTLLNHLSATNAFTAIIGLAMLVFLLASRKYATQFMMRFGCSRQVASSLAKAAPIVGVFASIATVYGFSLHNHGVAITGAIPAGLPSLSLHIPSMDLIRALFVPALLISLIGYVESISVGKTLAHRRRQKIDANQELVGLGAANLASGVSGGYPVTGGFSRTIVNFEAGAVTQMASVMTAMGIAFASLFLTPLLYFLPKATLAATIIVAVISLVDFSIIRKTWAFARSDCYAVLVTIVITLCYGVEIGVACGVGVSIALHLQRTSRPHIAEVGLIEGTEHFRNVNRYHVQTVPQILSLRPDESLFFANAQFLEETITEAVYDRGQIAHVILQCSAVNEVDYSALEMLETLNEQLSDQGIKLHLSEVKGPVMDKLRRTGLLIKLSGEVYVSQYAAYNYLLPNAD